MSKYVFSIPQSVVLPSGKVYSINKNIERNIHYHLKSDIKKYFLLNNISTFKALPVFTGQIKVTSILFKKTKRRCDLDNVLGMYIKFLGDALTTCGKIPDDNTDIIVEHRFVYGGISKEYPRIVTIIEDYSNADYVI